MSGTTALPKALTLPSGQRVTLRLDPDAKDPASPMTGSSRFAPALALLGSRVKLDGVGDVGDLPLGDFHVLRGVLSKHGLLEEEEIEIDCANCGEVLRVRPCAGLETGPWENGELGDPELDRTLAFGAAAPLSEGDQAGSEAHTITVAPATAIVFAPRTVREAGPLLAALSRPELEIDGAVVTAMGITELGPEKDPARIATTLMECDDATFSAVTDAWLDAHYVPRLAADTTCPACKAKNTVDAPYAREFDRGASRGEGSANPALPPLEGFVEIAHAIAQPLLDATPEPPELVVEEGTPAVDEGGVPLLGSYLPPPPKDAPVPTGPATVSIYYRTFEACAAEEPSFDWEAELRETIEHELEHHVYYLRGDDPMDEAERAEIAAEAVRIVGKTEAARRELSGFGSSFPDFVRRAWPLVLIAAVAVIVTIAESRCTPGSR